MTLTMIDNLDSGSLKEAAGDEKGIVPIESLLYDEELEDDEPEEDMSEALDVGARFIDMMEKLPELNENQRRVAYYVSQGMSTGDIAIRVGITKSYVRALKNKEPVQRMAEIFKGGKLEALAENLTAQQILDRGAARAAEVLVEKAENSLNEDAQIRAAKEVLDRTGHGTRREKPDVVINIDEDMIQMYQRARLEAGLVEDAEYEIVEDDPDQLTTPSE